MHKGKVVFKIASGHEESRPMTRLDHDDRVQRLHKHFLTRFFGPTDFIMIMN